MQQLFQKICGQIANDFRPFWQVRRCGSDDVILAGWSIWFFVGAAAQFAMAAPDSAGILRIEIVVPDIMFAGFADWSAHIITSINSILKISILSTKILK